MNNYSPFYTERWLSTTEGNNSVSSNADNDNVQTGNTTALSI